MVDVHVADCATQPVAGHDHTCSSVYQRTLDVALQYLDGALPPAVVSKTKVSKVKMKMRRVEVREIIM